MLVVAMGHESDWRKRKSPPYPTQKKKKKLRARLTLARAWSGLCLIRSDRVQHDLVGSLLGIGGVTLAPVVADRVSEDISSAVESGGSDRASDSGVTLETVLRILIPEVESTVRTSSAEGAVNGVERDSVNGVDIADIAVCGRGFTVALEGEVGGGILLLDVLNSTAALDGADREARGI